MSSGLDIELVMLIDGSVQASVEIDGSVVQATGANATEAVFILGIGVERAGLADDFEEHDDDDVES